MNYLVLIAFWIFTLQAFGQLPTKEVCESHQKQLQKMLAEARACQRDSDCTITQKFSKKIMCGKNMAIRRKAKLKGILSVAESTRFCARGGSCYHQDTDEKLKVKCVERECSIIE